MLVNIPLTIIPLIVYNIIAFGVLGAFPGDPWVAPVFTVEMISDARWTMVVGDLMVAAAIVFLFFEILKATRTTSGSIIDHGLSTPRLHPLSHRIPAGRAPLPTRCSSS